MLRHLLLVVVAALAVSVPLLERGFYTLDEGSLLSISDRIASGQVLYRDVCTAIFPGTFYLLAWAFRTFGTTILVERALGLAIFVGTAMAVYLLGRRLGSAPTALAGALSFVALKPVLFPLHTVLNYSQASFLCGALALQVVLGPPGTGRAAAAGVLAAGCGLFKQNYGASVVACALVALALDGRVPRARRARLAATFLVAGAAAALPVLASFWSAGAWPELYRNAARGPVAVVPGAYVVPWAPLAPTADLHHAPRMYLPSPVADLLLPWLRTHVLDPWPPVLPALIRLYYLAPLLATAGAAGLAWRRRDPAARGIAVVALMNLMLYGALFPRTDFAHLTALGPLSALLTAVLAGMAPGAWASRARRALVLVVAVTGGAHLALLLSGFDTPLRTPRGAVRVTPEAALRIGRILSAVERHVPAGEPIFAAPVDSFVYFLTSRPNPTRFDYLEPVNLGRAESRETVARLGGVRFAVLSDRDLREMRVPPLGDYAPELADYLLQSFEPLWQEVGALDEVHLCRRRPPRPRPAVDLLALPPLAEVVTRTSVAEAPSGSVWRSEFLASRTWEVLPPADASAFLRLSWRVDVPPGRSRLLLGLAGRAETFWRRAGPGIAWRVRVEGADGKPVAARELFLDPGIRPEDRPGHDVSIDLSSLAARAATIVVEAQAPASLAVRGYAVRWPAIVTDDPGAVGVGVPTVAVGVDSAAAP